MVSRKSRLHTVQRTGGGEVHKEIIKLLDATALHLESDLIDQVSSGYSFFARGLPASAVECAMRIVGGRPLLAIVHFFSRTFMMVGLVFFADLVTELITRPIQSRRKTRVGWLVTSDGWCCSAGGNGGRFRARESGSSHSISIFFV